MITMNLKDIKISTRLTLGLGVILLLVLLLATISFLHSGRLWKSTYDLYSHPYIVGRTVRDIQVDVLNSHRKMKDIAMDESLTADEIRNITFLIDNLEREIYTSFDLVYKSYLGPKQDIDSAFKSFTEWKPVRDKLIEIRLSEGRDKAFDYYKFYNRTFIEHMFSEIQKMIDFSTAKGDNFYQLADIERKQLSTRLIILTLIIFLVSVIITYILERGIRHSLKALTTVTESYSSGNYDVRSDYNALNEIGLLAGTFNKLAASVQNDIIIKENAAWISKLMMDENELKPFCKKLLSALKAKTESQIAAIYFLDKSKKQFEHFESIGLAAVNLRSFSASSAEGEFGSVLTERKIIRISHIPDDTVFSFPAVTGNFRPREIISMPIIDGDEMIAVISLASLKDYSDLSMRMLNDISLTITARLLGVISFQKIKDFSSMLDLQNRELDQKSKEMIMQADELKEYNIELELQKKQLDEANKLKSAFLSNMSHELRTPLNSVIALSGVLSRRLDGKIPADEYNYLGIIERNGKDLLSLINDILDFSRIEAGREEVTYSSFSVYEIVRNILNSLETIAEEKGISAVCNIPADIPDIISDQTKCHHIFQNILSNAVKFTEKGSVEVTASVNGKNIIVVVKDSGIGIPEDFLPFIFDEFRQADDNASRKYVGTGLGLAIVKKYCNLLSGSIAVVSVQGKGSTFTVTLPVKPSDSQIESDGKPLQSATINTYYSTNLAIKTGAGKTLLIVEDSEPQIIQLKDILSAEGFVINVARNGREALETIKLSIPDAMILDLQMPEVDGFEVLRQIRELKETRNIPVLILTAKHITKAELSFLKENHIYQLIQKGAVNRNDLLSYVKNLIIPEVKTTPETIKPGKYSGKQTTKASILVIEDNNDNLVTLRALLDSKYEIISASDGPEGLEKAVNNKPQMILVDISLPVMDGFKVLDEIKKIDDLSGIPVIALTARAMKGDRENLLAYGFDGYISKPVDSETFEKTIEEYLGNKQ